MWRWGERTELGAVRSGRPVGRSAGPEAAQPRRCLRQKQPRRSRGSRPNFQANRVRRRKFGKRQPGGGRGGSCALPPYANHSFLSLSIRCARPRGGGRGFRFPLPTPSGLPTHPNDQGLNPGPKRGSRGVQKPEKTIVLGPYKLSGHQMANVFFLIGLCPPLRFYHRIPPAAQ